MTERPITLRIPASTEYLPLARAAASAVCARLGYPVDRLDETVLAISEAASLLMQDAAGKQGVTVSLTPWQSSGLIGLDADLSISSKSGRPPRPTSFSWTVLASLVSNVSADIQDDVVTLRLRSRQEATEP